MLHLSLTKAQQAELKTYIARPLDDIPARRIQIIALSDDGYSVPQIAHAVTLHPINVRKWIRRYRATGLDGLRSTPSAGRPLLFSAELRADIARLYASSPRVLGLPFTRWTLRRMQQYLMGRGMVETVCLETLRQIVNAGK